MRPFMTMTQPYRPLKALRRRTSHLIGGRVKHFNKTANKKFLFNNYCILKITLAYGLLVPTIGFALTTDIKHEPSRATKPAMLFDIQHEPSAADWQRFFKLPPRQRAALWQRHADEGKKLSQWSWQWRLGWIKTCSVSGEEYCNGILKAGLDDPAMVVRAEAATALGKKFEGSHSRPVVDLLTAAYGRKENIRNNKPLYVQERILFALHQIGGAHALRQAKKLANHHKQTSQYWSKLTRR